ncbi:adenosylcobinamide-GDP ribazoletransferase [Enterobacter sp. RHBSTW-00994]|uniref:adenosylcobinamide-GDP ribazoletransferase n=1 Tax=Enterobacteriaceae TaxID=543 RepID=UPI0015E903F8|nr:MULTISPECIES: adenosylcobinamide-GDP ribazoletransferase [Enterobacteriaceae]MBM3073876.1 adenosylcobinamide-GDP ribazoletransferase [Lelliottia sp. RWM.1]QLR44673.1 adenosylcobinamide-GDP ribazoletransferase [Enterobacter sp. RHBSTW-00994]
MRLNMLWATMRLMTRIPIPAKWTDGVDFRHLGRGITFFPVIGAVVGALAAVLSLVVSQTGGGIYIGAIGYVLALVVLTGGFHLDGLADTCDGIFSARTRERMLEIMKDSRLGTFGGLALIFCLLIKTFAVIGLSHLPATALFSLLMCAPIAGRSVLVLGMYGQRYARDVEGLGNLFIGQITFREAAMTLGIGVAAVWLIAGLHGLAAFLVCFLVIFGMVRYLRNRLGGQTGDTLGALEECGEIVFLLALLWV